MNLLSLVNPTGFSSNSKALVWLLAGINFIHILDFVIVMPLGDRLRDELSITPGQFSGIVSAYGLSAMFTGLLAATVVDGWDRRATLLWSLAGFVIATFGCAASVGYAQLLIARICAGGCGGLVASTIMAYVIDCVPPERRGRALGTITSAFAFASTIGLPIGLYLAQWKNTYTFAFTAIAWAAVVVWLLAWFGLPSVTPNARVGSLQANFWRVLSRPQHRVSFAFMLMMVFSSFMIVPFIAPYLEANCGLPRVELPKIYLFGGIASFITMNACGYLTDRFGPRPVFISAACGAIVMTAVITNLPRITVLMAVFVTTLFMAVTSSRMVPAQTMMIAGADPQTRGAFASINTATSHFATGVGPLISGAIVGEAWPGGPLTHYWAAGVLAIFFGLLAIGLSLQLSRPVIAVA